MADTLLLWRVQLRRYRKGEMFRQSEEDWQS
jgi:hypothetical protein